MYGTIAVSHSIHMSTTTRSHIHLGTRLLLLAALIITSMWLFTHIVTGEGAQEGVLLEPSTFLAVDSEQSAGPLKEFAARLFGVPTVANMVPDTGLFIGVDTKTLELSLYEDGALRTTYPILSLGAQAAVGMARDGWYQVEKKLEKHVAAVGGFSFAHTLTFGPNASIHGAVTQAEKRDTSLSLGGIRLSDRDAQELFEKVAVGTPLYVVSADEQRSERGLALVSHAAPKPATTARAYLVGDLTTGTVLLAHNSEHIYPIASITKLMTALVATRALPHQSTVSVSSARSYTLGDLYYPLMLRSDNDVAEAIASVQNRNEFLARMNTQARALGMEDTRFYDASGLSPRNSSTARDLFVLAEHLYDPSNRFLLDITREQEMSIASLQGTTWRMTNQNKLSHDPHFLGGKLGYTDEAKQTSLALFAVPTDEGVRTVAVIVLGSDDWKQDTRTIMGWLFASVGL